MDLRRSKADFDGGQSKCTTLTFWSVKIDPGKFDGQNLPGKPPPIYAWRTQTLKHHSE